MTTKLSNDLPEEYWINSFSGPFNTFFVMPALRTEIDALNQIVRWTQSHAGHRYIETIHVTRGAGQNAPSIAHVYDLRLIADEVKERDHV